MYKIKIKAKSNSTISSGKTKIVYTQYYFWQSQNIVLLRRARVSPSFCVRKNSPDRSLKMSDCLKKKSWGDFLFSTCRTNQRPIVCASHCRQKKRRLCAFLFITKYNLPVHHDLHDLVLVSIYCHSIEPVV